MPENERRTRIRLHEPGTRTRKRKSKANRKRLTEPVVANLKIDKAKAYLVWDHGTDAQRGLAVNVLPSGVKTYTAFFYLPGDANAKSMALGRVGEMTLEEARRRTGEARGKAKDGFDPRLDDPRRSKSFSETVEDWHTRELVGRKNNKAADETKSFVLFHCAKLKSRPIGTIRYEEIDDLLADIRDKGKKGPTANRLHAHLMSMFRWAVRSRRIAHSPTEGMLKPWDGSKPRERDWFTGEAADEVIKTVWAYADEVGGDRGKFIKLLVLTGKRRTAIQTMQWQHISSDWYWQPPESLFAANKRCTPIPLPKLAQRILGQHQSEGRVLFVTEGNVNALSAALKKKVDGFLFHGIRHIVESRMGELGVLPHLRDLLLDHAVARSASGRGYDHGSYRDQLLEALGLWADHIEKLVTPQGVRLLR